VPGNVPSQPFQAQQTSEFGDRVELAGTARLLTGITVEMSSWACQSGNWNTNTCVTTPGATFNHDVTVTLYNVDHDTGALGAVIVTRTQTFAIPYRPSASASCTGGDAGKWFDGTGCNNGYATPITFTFDGTVVLPDELVWGISYNTSNYGPNPIGTQPCSSTTEGCPYDALNVGLSQEASTTVGTDVDPTGTYFNTVTAAWYCDGGTGGTGTFRSDSGCWDGYRPMARIEAVEPVSPEPDTDGDGVPDADDNCPADVNPSQKDKNHDGVGDACEHDAVVKAFNSGATDIKLPKHGGYAVRDVQLTIEGNHGPHPDLTRAVIEVWNLPSNCAIVGSGQDKRFGTHDDGPVVGSPGGVLFDVTRPYAPYQAVTFKFKVKLWCSAPVPARSVVVLKAIADHGADDYPAFDDEDLKPWNNVKIETLRITK
jgi:hypothetical protein